MAPTEFDSAGEVSRLLPHLFKPKHQKDSPYGTSSSMNGKPGSSNRINMARNPDLNEKNDRNSHEASHKKDLQHKRAQLPKLPRRHLRRRSISSHNDNETSIQSIPEVKYAKGGILLDRGGDGGEEVAPDETLYLSSKTNKAAGEYQMHPGFNNGANHNGNDINGNGNGLMNGGPPPPLHPYNGINLGGAGSHPHYPFISYPHPGAYPTYYDHNGQFIVSSNTTTSGLNVRGEEVLIVAIVLLFWIGSIILFFNRWGKIRMLEPYQPKFCESHRPSCPMVAEVNAISTTIPGCRERTFSKFNLSTEMLAGPNGSPHFVKCNYHGIPSADPAPGCSGFTTTAMVPGGLTIPAGFPGGGSTGMLNSHRNSIMMMNHHHHHHHHNRPRQNSVFVTSPSSQVSFYGSDTTLKNSSRKTKSAVDLPTLVLTGEFIDNVRRNSKNSITQL